MIQTNVVRTRTADTKEQVGMVTNLPQTHVQHMHACAALVPASVSYQTKVGDFLAAVNDETVTDDVTLRGQ